MNINTKSRADLKAYFVKNAIPTENNFADLIDAMVNQKDDAFGKPPGEPLSIEAAASGAAIKFYESSTSQTAAWTLSVKWLNNNNPASAFVLADSAGNARLRVDAAVGGAITLTGALNAGGGIAGPNGQPLSGPAGQPLSVSALNVSGPINANGGLTVPAGQTLSVPGTLTVTGPINANGGLTVPAGQTLSVPGTLTATGLINANGGLTVLATKTLTASSLTVSPGAAALSVTGGLTVSGPITAGGGLTVPVGQTLSVPGTLTATGLITANGGITAQNANNALTVTGRLIVINSTDARGGLTTSALNVTGDIITNGTTNALGGLGTSTLTASGLITAGGGLSTSTLTASGAVGTGALTVAGAINVSGGLVGPPNDYAKAQYTLNGGGHVLWTCLVTNGNVSGRLIWSNRFLAIGAERGGTFSEGHMNIDPPIAGVTVVVEDWGNHATRIADVSGVLLNAYEALYAVHTPGGNRLAVTLRVVLYTQPFKAPSNWILVAVVNNDNCSVKLGTGETIVPVPSSGIMSAGNNVKYFTDRGAIMSFDENHGIIFNRPANILEIREFGAIHLCPGARNGASTSKLIVDASGIKQEDWRPLTLQAGWINFGAPFNPPGYFKDSCGVVHLRGLIKAGACGASAPAIFTLAPGCRPPFRELFVVSTNDRAGRVDVAADGNVLPVGGDSFWLSLDGISFRAAP